MSACRYEGALYQDASKFLISIYYSKIPFQCKYISKGIMLLQNDRPEVLHFAAAFPCATL